MLVGCEAGWKPISVCKRWRENVNPYKKSIRASEDQTVSLVE